jgi:hypothetical protein
MPHIQELSGTDDMDWENYYSHGLAKGLSETEWRKEIGHRGWYLIHGAIDNYPCGMCRSSGIPAMNGFHEMHNILQGKTTLDHLDDFAYLDKQVHRAKERLGSVKLSPRKLDEEMSGHPHGHSHSVKVVSV